jgi:hypothetical protein
VDKGLEGEIVAAAVDLITAVEGQVLGGTDGHDKIEDHVNVGVVVGIDVEGYEEVAALLVGRLFPDLRSIYFPLEEVGFAAFAGDGGWQVDIRAVGGGAFYIHPDVVLGSGEGNPGLTDEVPKELVIVGGFGVEQQEAVGIELEVKAEVVEAVVEQASPQEVGGTPLKIFCLKGPEVDRVFFELNGGGGYLIGALRIGNLETGVAQIEGSEVEQVGSGTDDMELAVCVAGQVGEDAAEVFMTA